MPDDFYDNFVQSFNQTVDDEVAKAYRRVFTTPDGQYLLGIILERCKFMLPCENEADMALNNFAKEVLAYVYYEEQHGGTSIHRIIEFVKKTLRRSK
jgi:hypothetical protein